MSDATWSPSCPYRSVTPFSVLLARRPSASYVNVTVVWAPPAGHVVTLVSRPSASQVNWLVSVPNRLEVPRLLSTLPLASYASTSPLKLVPRLPAPMTHHAVGALPLPAGSN